MPWPGSCFSEPPLSLVMTASRRVKSVQLMVMGPWVRMPALAHLCNPWHYSWRCCDTSMMNIQSTLSVPHPWSCDPRTYMRGSQYGPHIQLNALLYDNLPHNSWWKLWQWWWGCLMFCEEEILDGSVKTITKTMFLALRSALRAPTHCNGFHGKWNGTSSQVHRVKCTPRLNMFSPRHLIPG